MTASNNKEGFLGPNETEEKLADETEVFCFRQRQRPGPPGEDTLDGPNKDLEDASMILELVKNGQLETKMPPRDTSRDHIYLLGKERLSYEEEVKLALRVQKYSDLDARNCLVMSNIGLVHLVANQFCRPSLKYEDLVQEGTMGLIRATETFEPGRGVRFSTYSVYWIRAKIQRLLQRIERDDIPAITGAMMHEDENGKRKRPRARKLSIENSHEEDSNRSLNDLLPSNTENPETIALNTEKKKVVREILFGIAKELEDDRLIIIIEKRLLTDEPETLTEVGEHLGLSREGARLLEAKLIKMARTRLKKWHRSNSRNS